MFDLRYHVASLTAVFVALVIGILVGVGLSGKGFVNDAERANLTARSRTCGSSATGRRSPSRRRAAASSALKDFADTAYPAVVPGRLEGQKVAVLFVGPIDRTVAFAIGKAVRDAGGTVVRTRSIGVPLDPEAVQKALRRLPAFRQLAGTDRLDDLGTALADELAAGGPTPLWDALGRAAWCRSVRAPRPLRSMPSSSFARPSRSVARRRRSSRASTPVSPARGRPPSAPRLRTRPRARFPAFALAGLSTVDSVDTAAGRLGLVLLLGGAEPGSYGVGKDAVDGVLPAIPPAPSSG